MPPRLRSGLAPALALLWLGCGTQVTVAPAERSQAGESCEAPADCAPGLSCVDLVCRQDPEQPPAPADGGTMTPPAEVPTRSGPGESCARRADCAGTLACIERSCRAGDTVEQMEGPRRGGHGESCVASNDCELGMACIAGACRTRAFALAHADSECHRVECEEDDDCCASFAPEDPTLCDELDEGCRAGVQGDCNLHVTLCTCSRLCDDSICVASVTCDSDLDCGGSGVLRCFAGKCAQCASDSDCVGTAACIGGLCRGGCERNEECPLLSECQSHQCVHVGCQSDRDCFFVSGAARSKCIDRECRTPCESDVACPQEFHDCVAGFCTFIGCESDDECRAALRLADLPRSDPDRAVCRPPAEP